MDFTYSPPLQKIPTIFKDNILLVVEKPAGLLSVPGRKEAHKDCLISRLQKSYPTAKIVHRLDMDTSGLMVVALSSDSHKQLSRQFENRAVHKTYIADVMGILKTESGCVEQPLRCDWPNRPLQIVDPECGKAAKTNWRILSNYGESSRLELTPITGRSHQLRVHCQYMGHPILGDRFYAPEAALNGYSRLHLHAHQLAFHHPETGEPLKFVSEVPFKP